MADHEPVGVRRVFWGCTELNRATIDGWTLWSDSGGAVVIGAAENQPEIVYASTFDAAGAPVQPAEKLFLSRSGPLNLLFQQQQPATARELADDELPITLYTACNGHISQSVRRPNQHDADHLQAARAAQRPTELPPENSAPPRPLQRTTGQTPAVSAPPVDTANPPSIMAVPRPSAPAPALVSTATIRVGDLTLHIAARNADDTAAILTRYADSIEELVRMGPGADGIDIAALARPADLLRRVVYGACEELAPVRGSLGRIAGWQHADRPLAVWAGAQQGVLLARMDNVAVIIARPPQDAGALYLPTDLRVDRQHDFYPDALTADQVNWNRRMADTHGCRLPQTDAEVEEQRRLNHFPDRDITVSFGFGRLTVNPEYAPTSRFQTLHVEGLQVPINRYASLEAALDCDPTKLHFNCPDLRDQFVGVPVLASDARFRPNTFTVGIKAMFNLRRAGPVQLYHGPQITNYYTDAGNLVYALTAEYTLGFRSDWLSWGNHLFLPGVEVSVGGQFALFTGMREAAGVSGGLSLPLWRFGNSTLTRMGGPSVELGFRVPMGYLWGAQSDDADFTARQGFPGAVGMTGPDTPMVTVSLGWQWSTEPRPPASPVPEVISYLGTPLLLPTIAFATQFDQGRADALLQLNDLDALIAQSGARVSGDVPGVSGVRRALFDIVNQLHREVRAHGTETRFAVIGAADDLTGGQLDAHDQAIMRAEILQRMLELAGMDPNRLTVQGWSTRQVARALELNGTPRSVLDVGGSLLIQRLERVDE